MPSLLQEGRVELTITLLCRKTPRPHYRRTRASAAGKAVPGGTGVAVVKPDTLSLQKLFDDRLELPTVPAVAMAVLRMAQNPRVSIDQMARVIEKDPALAAKVFRFVNSSYFGLDKPISSLSQAIVRLGIRATTVLTLSFSLVEASQRVADKRFDFPSFWLRSLVSAVAARRIAHYSVRDQADQAFVGALLADIGCPFLCRAQPERYAAVMKRYRMTSDDLSVIESRALGVTHADVSSLLLGRWHLSETLVAAVGAHCDPASLDPDTPQFTIAVVIMAASLIADMLIRGPIEQRVAALADLFRRYFTLQPAHVNVILGSLRPELQDIASMLDLRLPPLDELENQAKTEMLRVAMGAARPPAGAAVAGG